MPTLKPDLHLQTLWNMKGIFHYELLKHRKMINADFYQQQLDSVNEQLCRKYPCLVNQKGVIL